MKEMLEDLKEILEKGDPIMYLHNPEDGKIFGVLIHPDLLDKIPDVQEIAHGHLEYEEEEV